MGIIKMLMFAAVLVGFGGFNAKLYLARQGIEVSSAKSADGWKTVCRYYTPFRFYDVAVNVGASCPAQTTAP